CHAAFSTGCRSAAVTHHIRGITHHDPRARRKSAMRSRRDRKGVDGCQDPSFSGVDIVARSHSPLGPWSPGAHAALDTGLALIVCNRTGRDLIMDFTWAESIVALGGRRLLSLSWPRSAILQGFGKIGILVCADACSPRIVGQLREGGARLLVSAARRLAPPRLPAWTTPPNPPAEC